MMRLTNILLAPARAIGRVGLAVGRLFASISDLDRSPLSPFWYSPVDTLTKTGQRVNVANAMTVGCVFQGVRLRSQTIAMLPRSMFQKKGGRTEKRPDHPTHRIIHDEPNPWMTPMEFIEICMARSILRGNAYSEIQYNPRLGVIQQVIPVDPSRVDQKLDTDGTMVFIVDKGRPTERTLRNTESQKQVHHLRGFGDGMKGISIVAAMRETLGLSMSLEEHASRFFANSAAPSGAISHPGTLTEEAAKRLNAFIGEHTGVSSHHGVLVLEEDMKWQRIGLTNRDSQFLEARKFQVTEVARWLGIPPHMLMDLEKATFSNIEAQDLSLVKYTFQPDITRFEQSIDRDMIPLQDRRDGYFAKFNLDALYRAEINTRFAAYVQAVQNGLLTQNEIREIEDRNPVEGGDEPMTPMNMQQGGESNTLVAELQRVKHLSVQTDRILTMVSEYKEERSMLETKAEWMIRAAVTRILRKEISAVQKKAEQMASDTTAWTKWVDRFYRTHQNYVSDVLGIDGESATQYCQEQKDELLTGGVGVIEKWESERYDKLYRAATGGSS